MHKHAEGDYQTKNHDNIDMIQGEIEIVEISRTPHPAHPATNRGAIFKSVKEVTVKVRDQDGVIYEEAGNNFVEAEVGGRKHMFRKSQVKGDGRLYSADEVKALFTKNDLVQAVSTEALEGDQRHFHALWVSVDNGCLRILTSYESIETDDEGRPIVHDHRVLRNADATLFILLMSGNPRHEHPTPREQVLMDIIRTRTGDGLSESALNDLVTNFPSIEKETTMNEEQLKQLADAARVTKAFGLSHDLQDFYKTLATDEDRDAFLEKSTEDQTAQMKEATPAPVEEKSADGDETVTVDGVTYSKSKDEGAYNLAKNLQAEKAERVKETLLREKAERVKKFNVNFKSLPINEADGELLVKAIDSVSSDAEVVKRITDAVRAGASALAGRNSKSAGSAVSVKEQDMLDEGLTTKEARLARLEEYTDEAFAKATAEGRKNENSGYAITRSEVYLEMAEKHSHLLQDPVEV